jgi:hypothetical protein
LQGYVGAGYSSFTNYPPTEWPMGCYNGTGIPVATSALIEKEGTTRDWLNAYVVGWFDRVIQTSDGGYLATGTTVSTLNLAHTTPLYYNPGETPGDLTDSFSPGIGHGCDPVGGSVRHAMLVKINPNGSLAWQYLYGMESYRNANGNPSPDDAYTLGGEGFGLAEEPNGNFLMVGSINDPQMTFSCGSSGPSRLGRAFMIEVTSAGLVVSNGGVASKYFLNTNTLPNSAVAIAKYQDSVSAFHYVISGTEYFQSTSGVNNPFVAASGCSDYQKVFAQRVSQPVAGTPFITDWQTDLTVFNSTDSMFQTSSQNTFDVQINNYFDTGDGQHTEVLLPVIVDCNGCLYTAFNYGTGMVFRLNSLDGSQLSASTLPKPITGSDLRMRIIPTPDGGFATISTARDPADPPVPSSLTFPCGVSSSEPPCGTFAQSDLNDFDTDTYVARYLVTGALLWDQTYRNVPPTGVNFTPGTDIVEAVGSLAGRVYPADWQFAECVYSISQSQDGGFVVAGNNSYYLDDDYMLKLKPELPYSPLTGVNDPDLMIRDTIYDAGFEPNPDTGPMWISPDIWVRNDGDCTNSVNQSPEYPGTTTVCVRVTNNNTTSTKADILHVYFAPASTGLSWPSSWTEITPLTGISVAVSASSNSVYSVQWNLTTSGHVCLLARIETSTTAPYGMTYPEIASVDFNTRNNAKIAWKNEEVLTMGGTGTGMVFNVNNIQGEPVMIRLGFGVSKTGQGLDTFLNYGTITVALGPDVFTRWVNAGSVGQGVQLLANQLIQLVGPYAWIGNIPFAAGETQTFSAQLVVGSLPSSTVEVDFDVLQYSTVQGMEQLVGGLRFNLRVTPATTPSITLSPATSLTFGPYTQRSLSLPGSQLVVGTLTDTTPGTLAGTVSVTSFAAGSCTGGITAGPANWLAVTQSGSNPVTFTLAVNPNVFPVLTAVTTCSGEVSVNSGGVTPAAPQVSIPVSFTISPPTSPNDAFVEVCKASSSTIPVTGNFTFTSPSFATLPKNSATVPVGECSGPIPVLHGPVPITETLPAGITLNTAVASGYNPTTGLMVDRRVSFNLAGGTETVTAVAGGVSVETVATFTNQGSTGQLKICKIAGSGVPLGTSFNFTATSPATATGPAITQNYAVTAGPASEGGNCVIDSSTFPMGTQVTVAEVLPGLSFYIYNVASAVAPAGTTGGRSIAATIGIGYTEVTFTNSRTIPTPLMITTLALNGGVVGTAYSQTLTATGGMGPYTWQLIGGRMPLGLTLNAATGLISGTPTSALPGSLLTFQVTDSSSPPRTVSATFALTVTLTPTGLSIVTTSLSNGALGVPYSQTLAAIGGTGPYTWQLTSGTLPAGLTLNAATGVVAGTPTALATATPLTFKVTDSSTPSQTATVALTLTITTPTAGPLAIATTALNSGVVGTAYSQTLTATGGMGPYTWQLIGGRMPLGLTLNAATGLISGTPTSAGPGSLLRFQVTDSGNPQQTATAAFAVTIGSTF